MMLTFWLIIVAVVIGSHLVIIKIENIEPDKGAWLFIRLSFAFGLLAVEHKIGEHDILLTGLAFLFSGWLLHDAIIGWILHGKPWYLNKTGVLDKLQHRYGGASTWFVLKAIGCFTTVIMYYLNEI
jgi:hypothetical protein